MTLKDLPQKLMLKNKFTIEHNQRKIEEWLVTIECYGKPPHTWSFDTLEEAKAFKDSWIDITLTDKDIYKIGTKWWFFDGYYKSIINVEIIDIKVERWNSISYRYFSSVLVCKIVGTNKRFELDIDFELDGEKIPNKEEALKAFSKRFKSDYSEFIQK